MPGQEQKTEIQAPSQILSKLQLLLNLNSEDAGRVYRRLFEIIKEEVEKENPETKGKEKIDEIHRRMNQLLTNPNIQLFLSQVGNENLEEREEILKKGLEYLGLNQEVIRDMMEDLRGQNYESAFRKIKDNIKDETNQEYAASLIISFSVAELREEEAERRLKEFENLSNRVFGEDRTIKILSNTVKSNESMFKNLSRETQEDVLEYAIETGDYRLISLIKKYAPEVFFETMKELVRREALEKLLGKQEKSIQRIKELMQEKEREVREIMERVAEEMQKLNDYAQVMDLILEEQRKRFGGEGEGEGLLNQKKLVSLRDSLVEVGREFDSKSLEFRNSDSYSSIKQSYSNTLEIYDRELF